MLTENQVVKALVAHLKRAGWHVVSQCTTDQRGVDLVVKRHGRRLPIEAKGGTSTRRGSANYETGFTSTQKRHHVAMALFKATELLSEGEHDAVAIALPDDDRHRDLIKHPPGAKAPRHHRLCGCARQVGQGDR